MCDLGPLGHSEFDGWKKSKKNVTAYNTHPSFEAHFGGKKVRIIRGKRRYVNKLRTQMYQNTCIGFKLGYVDAKSDAIAFSVKTYPSGSFIKNRTNMHEMQNRMKIAFCVKSLLPSILLAYKGGPT